MRKVVLITGASRGIGAATARAFARAGYDVGLNYLHSEQCALALERQIKQTGVRVCPVCADISDPAQAAAMVSHVQKELGGVHVLVNNAGTSQQRLFTDITDDEWAATLGVHLTGTFTCCRQVLPAMISRKAGAIINVSSVWGITGASCEAAYSAAKAGVIGLTKALAKEVGPSGIRVNCVAPGVIDTDMNAHLDQQTRRELCDETSLLRLGTPEEVAQVILFLASDAASFITGQVLSPNGGLVI
ncbi:MAG: 3-oxoacyl-ACP reductase FabG [Eubacteriales bacterium]|nr:3-oxoacyl-ACP reductase FabG [Eubacteriales bacterium]